MMNVKQKQWMRAEPRRRSDRRNLHFTSLEPRNLLAADFYGPIVPEFAVTPTQPAEVVQVESEDAGSARVGIQEVDEKLSVELNEEAYAATLPEVFDSVAREELAGPKANGPILLPFFPGPKANGPVLPRIFAEGPKANGPILLPFFANNLPGPGEPALTNAEVTRSGPIFNSKLLAGRSSELASFRNQLEVLEDKGLTETHADEVAELEYQIKQLTADA